MLIYVYYRYIHSVISIMPRHINEVLLPPQAKTNG